MPDQVRNRNSPTADGTEPSLKNPASQTFARQRAACRTTPYPALGERKDALLALETLLIDHQIEIAEAISRDLVIAVATKPDCWRFFQPWPAWRTPGGTSKNGCDRGADTPPWAAYLRSLA
jgi:hypothetical protein